MAVVWKNLDTGIRAKEHPTRKHGIKPDLYFVLRYRVDGTPKQEALGWASEGWTLAKAREHLAQLKAAKRTGQGPVTLRESRNEAKAAREERARLGITFSEYWNTFYIVHRDGTKKDETIRKENSHFATWLEPFIGQTPLRNLDALHFEHIKVKMDKKSLAPRTKQIVFATVAAVWKDAVAHNYVTGPCPTKKVKLGKIVNGRTRYLSAQEAQNLLAEIQKRDPKAWAFTLACLHTGGRLSEVASLTWGNIKMAERTLTLMHTKTGVARAIPLTNTLYTVLLELFAQRTSFSAADLVFTNADGTQWRSMPSAYRKAVDALQLNEGREARDRLVFHSLRHTAASALLATGEGLRTIQSIFGWSTLKMVERYTHPEESDKVSAMANFDAKFSLDADKPENVARVAVNAEASPLQGNDIQRPKVIPFKRK